MGREEAARIILGLKGKECSHSFQTISMNTQQVKKGCMKNNQSGDEENYVNISYLDWYQDRKRPDIT